MTSSIKTAMTQERLTLCLSFTPALPLWRQGAMVSAWCLAAQSHVGWHVQRAAQCRSCNHGTGGVMSPDLRAGTSYGISPITTALFSLHIPGGVRESTPA